MADSTKNGLAQRGTGLVTRLMLLCLLLLNAGLFGGIAWLIGGETAAWIVTEILRGFLPAGRNAGDSAHGRAESPSARNNRCNGSQLFFDRVV